MFHFRSLFTQKMVYYVSSFVLSMLSEQTGSLGMQSRTHGVTRTGVQDPAARPW